MMHSLIDSQLDIFTDTDKIISKLLINIILFRRKAVESEGWPRLEVVEEFFKLDTEAIHHSFIWRCPDPAGFIKVGG